MIDGVLLTLVILWVSIGAYWAVAMLHAGVAYKRRKWTWFAATVVSAPYLAARLVFKTTWRK